MIAALLRWSARAAGMLLAPRRTASMLGDDEGARDGTWAVLAFVLAGRLDQVVFSLARVVRLQSFDALLLSLADLGISLLPPVAATFAAELVLGRARGHRAGTTLAPLVVLAAVGTFVSAAGYRFEPPWLLDALGVAATLGLAAWIRPAVAPLRETSESAPVEPVRVVPIGAAPRGVRIAGPMLAAILGVAGALELVAGVRAWSTVGPLAPGEATPSFAVAWLDGGKLTDADLPGRVSVVTFWATWCGYCRAELAELDVLDDGYDAERVRFVAVNHEGGGLSSAQATSLARRYRDHTGLGLAIAVDDGGMSRGFRVGPIPHTVVLDRGGRIRHVHQGTVSAETIGDEVDALLAE